MSIAFVPVLPVLFVLYKWRMRFLNAAYAISRMLMQLLIVGYFLAYLFEQENLYLVLAVLMIMVFASSWIALGSVAHQRKTLYKHTITSIVLGGGITLVSITQGVLDLDPWFTPRYMIPLAGMIFANAMNSVSLAADRMDSEIRRNASYNEARTAALQTSLIPTINSLFAVGLVSLPGMMTGQILSGVSPLIAARYQIVVMCMVFGSAGISSIIFLMLSKKQFCLLKDTKIDI